VKRHTRRRDQATRIILVAVLVLVLGDVALATADALVTAAVSLLALVTVCRALASDVLPLYQRPRRYGLVALGLLLTASVAALILLTSPGMRPTFRDRLSHAIWPIPHAMACVTPLSASGLSLLRAPRRRDSPGVWAVHEQVPWGSALYPPRRRAVGRRRGREKRHTRGSHAGLGIAHVGLGKRGQSPK